MVALRDVREDRRVSVGRRLLELVARIWRSEEPASDDLGVVGVVQLAPLAAPPFREPPALEGQVEPDGELPALDVLLRVGLGEGHLHHLDPNKGRDALPLLGAVLAILVPELRAFAPHRRAEEFPPRAARVFRFGQQPEQLSVVAFELEGIPFLPFFLQASRGRCSLQLLERILPRLAGSIVDRNVPPARNSESFAVSPPFVRRQRRPDVAPGWMIPTSHVRTSGSPFRVRGSPTIPIPRTSHHHFSQPPPRLVLRIRRRAHRLRRHVGEQLRFTQFSPPFLLSLRSLRLLRYVRRRLPHLLVSIWRGRGSALKTATKK
mmetsp:Transcript_26444/g.85477  ORF Transcript_26444/g.85477 Transcript_26444/m.85477 type:complete len:319 (+) Transcript_26444:2050-3006(+)